MNKKLIVTGGILVLISGGLLRAIVTSSESEHTSRQNEYYYNDISTTGVPSHLSLDEIEPTDSDEVKLDITPESLTCLVNKEYPLPADYVPNDLVLPDIDFNISYYAEKKLLRNDAAVAIEKLFQAAKESGLSLYGVSGYRSYKRQEEIYNSNLKTKGEEHTNKYSAKPGYSEHQTGLSMDVSTPSIGFQLIENFGTTPEGLWLAENCHLYGFIIRYPKDKPNITGYAYEPWHIRYVGVKLATYLTENELTLEEYYHAIPSEDDIADDLNETIVDVDDDSTPSSIPPMEPSIRPTATPAPSVAPVVTPSPSPSAPSTPEVSMEPEASKKPSPHPSVEPVESAEPSVVPTEKPSPKPTHKPSNTPKPTEKPTPTPSPEPSVEPEPSKPAEENPSELEEGVLEAIDSSTPSTENDSELIGIE